MSKNKLKKGWIPKWQQNRETQPQFRDRNGNLIERTPAHDPSLSNHKRHQMRKARRAYIKEKELENVA